MANTKKEKSWHEKDWDNYIISHFIESERCSPDVHTIDPIDELEAIADSYRPREGTIKAFVDKNLHKPKVSNHDNQNMIGSGTYTASEIIEHQLGFYESVVKHTKELVEKLGMDELELLDIPELKDEVYARALPTRKEFNEHVGYMMHKKLLDYAARNAVNGKGNNMPSREVGEGIVKDSELSDKCRQPEDVQKEIEDDWTYYTEMGNRIYSSTRPSLHL